MIKNLKRILRNIKWAIFNHPPVNICAEDSKYPNPPCNYCQSIKGTLYIVGVYCICNQCQKKVFDFILKQKEFSK